MASGVSAFSVPRRVAYLLFSTCYFTPAVLPLDERCFKIAFKPLVSSAAVAEQLESVRNPSLPEPEPLPSLRRIGYHLGTGPKGFSNPVIYSRIYRCSQSHCLPAFRRFLSASSESDRPSQCWSEGRLGIPQRAANNTCLVLDKAHCFYGGASYVPKSVSPRFADRPTLVSSWLSSALPGPLRHFHKAHHWSSYKQASQSIFNPLTQPSHDACS
jgi:hypothetical protein